MKKVTVTNDRGMLRLKWRHNKKVRSLSLGLEDTRTNRAIAISKARMIAEDIEYHRFDKTLNKYRPHTIGNTGMSCAELFEAFSKYKAKDFGVSERSIETRYKPIRLALDKWLQHQAHGLNVMKAKDFRNIQLETVTKQTAKSRLWLLCSCWDWAIEEELIAAKNPWKGLARGIKTYPTQEVKPFTKAEIIAILKGFSASRHYHPYADFVTFLFGTGCRFGEAVALRWEHLGDNYKTVWIGESISRGHHYKGTKNGRDRTFALTSNLQAMLHSRFEKFQAHPSDLVFPAPRGGPIHDQNFRRRAWKSLLEEAHIPYRRLYAIRHSVLTYALKNGSDPIEVAEAAGHDKQILFSTYAHAMRDQPVFQEFEKCE